MHSLPVFIRLTGRDVILVGDGDIAAAKRRLIERAGGRCVGEDGQATLAFVATDDADDARNAAARLKARGILVNVADQPDLCDFTLPAIVDRDPVILAIGTGGASAGLAKALRMRLEALLPQSLGRLADALYAARATLRLRFPDARDRRQAIDAALLPGAALDPMDAAAADAVSAWLASGSAAGPGGRLISIAVVSDDPDELTLRAARLLGQADHVYHHPAIAPAILDRARADAGRTACLRPPDPPAIGLALFLDRG